MRRNPSNPRRGQHPFALRATQEVHRLVPARQMAAFDQRRAAARLINDPGGGAKFLRRPNFFSNQHFRLGQVWRDQRGQRQQVAPENPDGVAREEAPAAGGDHDRIHHQGNAPPLPEEARHFADNRGGTQQAGFDGRRRRIGKDGLHLRPHHFGRARLEAGNGPGILGRDAGDGAGAMHAQRGKGPQIGLNARPASTVGAGDGQRHWLGFDF